MLAHELDANLLLGCNHKLLQRSIYRLRIMPHAYCAAMPRQSLPHSCRSQPLALSMAAASASTSHDANVMLGRACSGITSAPPAPLDTSTARACAIASSISRPNPSVVEGWQ